MKCFTEKLFQGQKNIVTRKILLLFTRHRQFFLFQSLQIPLDLSQITRPSFKNNLPSMCVCGMFRRFFYQIKIFPLQNQLVRQILVPNYLLLCSVAYIYSPGVPIVEYPNDLPSLVKFGTSGCTRLTFGLLSIGEYVIFI